MSILKVAHMGHPILREVAVPVPPERFASAEFQRFCDDLLESMYELDGAGLAAPQVHVSERVVVFELEEEDGPMFLVNPVITPLTEETAGGYEGCLSVPGMRGRVERVTAVRVECRDRHGKVLSFEAHGWAARVVQHECDHLDGVLYIDRADPKSLAFLPEFRRYGPLVPSGDGEE
ncbi:MAG: peptide deformylase [Pseudomonadota bacterium]|nr:peptide deformylase [Pseudomonadota bacterium]